MLIWLHRTFGLTVLLFGTLGALSYFFRSVEFGDLVGMHPEHSEAIGFPWIQAAHYCTGPDWELIHEGFYKNLGAGLVTWLILATVVLANRGRLDRLEKGLRDAAKKTSRPKTNFQFSLRGLLILMAVCSVGAACLGQLMKGRPEVLLGIYLFGPWLLVGLAYLPARIHWQQRVALIIPLTLILIALGVVAGALLQPPLAFDKTLIGIFVCWTPQAGLAAIVLSIVFLLQQLWQRTNWREQPPAVPSAVESAHPPAG